MPSIRQTPFTITADKTDTVGSNTNNNVCGADNGLCLVVPVNANIGGAKARFRPRYGAVNDQLGLRRKDMVTSATAHGAKQITTGCSNALKAAYSDYLLSIDRNTASRIFVLKWTLYAASACRLSGIAPDVVRREGY